MTNIQTNQLLEYDNLLTFRGKISRYEINDKITQIATFMENEHLQKIGPIITCTHSVAVENGKEILDFEIMIPVNTTSITSNEYSIKPKFRIANALMCSHNGNQNELVNIYNKIKHYIHENQIQNVTNFYTVSRNIDDNGNLNIVVYIGVSNNIL